MIFYVFDSFDNGEYIYFKVDVDTSKVPKQTSFPGKDFKFEFLGGNEFIYVNRISRIVNQCYNGCCTPIKQMYYEHIPDQWIGGIDIVTRCVLINPGNIREICETIAPAEYFSPGEDIFTSIKNEHEGFFAAYKLRKEIETLV